MIAINYFKQQAKKLFKDYKTGFQTIDYDGNVALDFRPKFFDIGRILFDFANREENLTLMNMQHLIAKMVGYSNWTELINASSEEQELAKLLFEYQDHIAIEDWEIYLSQIEHEIGYSLDSRGQIELFARVVPKMEPKHNPFPSYRLKKG